MSRDTTVMHALAGQIPRQMNQHVYGHGVPAAYVITSPPFTSRLPSLHQTFYHIACYLQHDAPS